MVLYQITLSFVKTNVNKYVSDDVVAGGITVMDKKLPNNKRTAC